MHRTTSRRSAYTLVELLVVIAIVLLITSLAVAIIPPSRFERHVQEAARTSTAMFQVARDLAVRTGRPHGVLIERPVIFDPEADTTLYDGSVGHRLSVVSQPPAYCGDFPDSRAAVTYQGGTYRIQSADRLGRLSLNTGITPSEWQVVDGAYDQMWLSLVRNGDVIRFEGISVDYRIEAISPPAEGKFLTSDSFPWELVPLTVTDQSLNFPLDTLNELTGIPLRYSIEGQPVRVPGRTNELPETVAFDLDASGFGIDGIQFRGRRPASGPASYSHELDKTRGQLIAAKIVTNKANYQPIVVMFGPRGSITSVAWGEGELLYDVGGIGLPYKSNVSVPAISMTTDSVKDSSGNLVPSPPAVVSTPIHLLLGKRSQTRLQYQNTAIELPNWADPEALWITLLPLNGRVKVSPNNAFEGVETLTKRQALTIGRAFAMDDRGLSGQ